MGSQLLPLSRNHPVLKVSMHVHIQMTKILLETPSVHQVCTMSIILSAKTCTISRIRKALAFNIPCFQWWCWVESQIIIKQDMEIFVQKVNGFHKHYHIPIEKLSDFQSKTTIGKLSESSISFCYCIS